MAVLQKILKAGSSVTVEPVFINLQKNISLCYFKRCTSVYAYSYSDFTFFEILVDKDNPYRIVETEKEQIVKKNMNRDFCFGLLKLKSLTIILAPHPERKSKIKLSAFKNYILSLLSTL